MAFGANSRGLNPGSFRRPLLPGRLARTRVSCLPHATEQGRMKIAGSMLYHGRYGPASRSTEIWTFLEDDVRCAAWFNSGYTLTRQSHSLRQSIVRGLPQEFRKIWLSEEMRCTSLALQWRHAHASVHGGGHFTRPSSAVSPEKYRNLNTLGDDFRSCFRIFGSTADTRAHVLVDVGVGGTRDRVEQLIAP